MTLKSREGMIVEHRQRIIPAAQEAVYKTFLGLGGKRGWFYLNWAWRIRGFIAQMIGGVGLRRGRRDPNELRVGDALDFWRVEAVEPGQSLRLRAEMKVPGKAWLQWRVNAHGEGQVRLSQTAYFAPRGLMGWIYWYALYPVHALIFSGLIDQLAKRAVSSQPERP